MGSVAGSSDGNRMPQYLGVAHRPGRGRPAPVVEENSLWGAVANVFASITGPTLPTIPTHPVRRSPAGTSDAQSSICACRAIAKKWGTKQPSALGSLQVSCTCGNLYLCPAARPATSENILHYTSRTIQEITRPLKVKECSVSMPTYLEEAEKRAAVVSEDERTLQVVSTEEEGSRCGYDRVDSSPPSATPEKSSAFPRVDLSSGSGCEVNSQLPPRKKSSHNAPSCASLTSRKSGNTSNRAEVSVPPSQKKAFDQLLNSQTAKISKFCTPVPVQRSIVRSSCRLPEVPEVGATETPARPGVCGSPKRSAAMTTSIQFRESRGIRIEERASRGPLEGNLRPVKLTTRSGRQTPNRVTKRRQHCIVRPQRMDIISCRDTPAETSHLRGPKSRQNEEDDLDESGDLGDDECEATENEVNENWGAQSHDEHCASAQSSAEKYESAQSAISIPNPNPHFFDEDDDLRQFEPVISEFLSACSSGWEGEDPRPEKPEGPIDYCGAERQALQNPRKARSDSSESQQASPLDEEENSDQGTPAPGFSPMSGSYGSSRIQSSSEEDIERLVPHKRFGLGTKIKQMVRWIRS